MADISPYTISVPDEAIQDLKTRLSHGKFPSDELEGAGWDYGSPLNDVKRFTSYWRDNYDWRKTETQLNTYPHFTTSIQCRGFEPLRIHFLHQKSRVPNAIPLLFVHGWPGSFLEALKILRPLAEPEDPKAPAFHVVALSLPNYGFSEGSKKKGFALAQYAETCNKLMLKLGYNEYVTQGGDCEY
jgi:pimeloyl-ACP methyl ester carboxylesterase